MSVWVGECYVNGKKIESPVSLNNGLYNDPTLSDTHTLSLSLAFHFLDSLLKLGNDLELKYINSSEIMLPRRRLLPQTPGQLLSEAPPTKPTRTQPQPLVIKAITITTCSLLLFYHDRSHYMGKMKILQFLLMMS